MTETITYSLAGQEDLNIGNGTFDVTLADGRVVTLHQISHNSFPMPTATLSTLPAAGTAGREYYLTDIEALVIDNGTAWVTSPPGRGVFFADATSGADLDSVLNTLIAAMPAGGGTIDARGFTGTQACNATITLSKPVKLLLGNCTITSTATPIFDVTTSGAAVIEGNSRAQTIIQTTSASQTAIRVNTTAPCRVSKLTINHSGSTKSSGAGISLTAPANQNELSRIEDLSIQDQWIGVHSLNAARWVVRECHIKDYKGQGVTVENQAAVDYGQSTIINCVIEHAATTAGLYGVYQLSASTLRVVDCTITGGQYGVAIDAANTTLWTTISRNTISGQSSACIGLYRTSGSATFTGVLISENVLVCLAGIGVLCTSAGIFYLTITNNDITIASPNQGIYLSAVTLAYIAGNVIAGNAASAIGIQMDSGANAVHIGENSYYQLGTTVINNATTSFMQALNARGTISIDPGSIAATSRGAITWTLTGAVTTDRISMEPPAGLHDDLVFAGASITGTNTVTVYLYNPTASPIDDGANTWKYTWSRAIWPSW